MTILNFRYDRQSLAAAPRNPLARECLARLWTCALLCAVDGSFGSIAPETVTGRFGSVRRGPASYRILSAVVDPRGRIGVWCFGCVRNFEFWYKTDISVRLPNTGQGFFYFVFVIALSRRKNGRPSSGPQAYFPDGGTRIRPTCSSHTAPSQFVRQCAIITVL